MKIVIKKLAKSSGRLMAWFFAVFAVVIMISPILVNYSTSLIYSTKGQFILQNFLEAQLKNQGYRVKFSGFRFVRPANIHIDQIKLLGQYSTSITVKDAHISIDIMDLPKNITAKLSIGSISVGDASLDGQIDILSLRAKAGINIGNNYTGDFNVKANIFDKNASLKTDFLINKEIIRLKDISISAPDLMASGYVSLNLKTDIIYGNLSAVLDKLVSYQDLIGSGHNIKSAKLNLSLSGEQGKQKTEINVSAQEYKNSNIGVDIRDINLKSYLLDQNYVVSSLSMRDDTGGYLQGAGNVNISDYAIDFSLKINNIHALKGGVADGKISADLKLNGHSNNYKLSGTLRTDKIEIKLPEQFGEDIAQVNIVKTKSKNISRQGLGANIKLDLLVDAPNQIFVRGWGLDSEFGGKVNINGTLNKPLFDGSLGLYRGRYNEFGKSFKLTKASLNFSGSVPPSPYLDIIAQTKAGGIIAQILITGSAQKPEIGFSSIPIKPADEVVSYILFGEDMGELSPFQAVQLAQTLRRFSGNGSGGGSGFDPVGSLRAATGLDDLRFETDENGGANIGAGKYLSDKVYLEFETGSQDGSSNANIEVEIAPNITIESEIGQDARGGAGVFWKWDY